MRKARSARRRGVVNFAWSPYPLFTLMFAIIDLGRYAITVQSLQALANDGARAIMINNCYTNAVIKKSTPTACTGDPLPCRCGQSRPLPRSPICWRSHAYLLNVDCGSKLHWLIVTASQPGFTMLMPVWGLT